MTTAATQLDAQGLPVGYNFRPDWEVTPRQLKAMLADGADLLLIDCRLPAEHQLCRIDGATLVPVQEAPQRLSELAEHASRRTIVYCHHGMRSLRMTGLLRQAGFADVKSMAGGIDLWSMDVDPAVPRY